MKSYPEYKAVQKCLRQIEAKLGWGNPTEWHNDVYIELSEIIQGETKTLLSPTTLKRVWGKVSYDSAPSISTLNTLAQYAGYKNWRDFKNNENAKKPTWFEKKIHPNLGVIAISAGILAVTFISFYSMIGTSNHLDTVDLSKIQFSCHPITEEIPNSVVFDFELDHITSDSIYIQQFWDETKTIKINANQKQATGIYYYPGYFRAKLLIDGTIIKEHDLFIKSNGWLATIDYKPIPKYINKLNGLSLPETAIDEIKQSEQPLTSAFHYIDDFQKVSGDNFRLKTTIKNIYNDKWAVCQNVRIIIVGTKGAHIIPFAIPGCASNIGMMMSDVSLSGKKHDLSPLCMDLSLPTDLRIEVVDKVVSVYLDNEKRYSNSYNESIGKIAGIRYSFLGAGEVSNLTLSNLSETTVIINEEF